MATAKMATAADALAACASSIESMVARNPWKTAGCTLLGYALLCAALRMRRSRKTHASYPYKTRADFSNMTADHAFEIQRSLFEYEFPFTALKALQFALFRTYGIPTISKLLVQTKQLSDVKNAPKRYVDTEVLIQEFTAHAPGSERANAAIARMNYLHSLYQASGKISNSDMLYTLALFALEPQRWIDRYEWRHLTDLEVCALGTFWKSVGDAMGISYAELPSCAAGWKDGLHWWQEVRAWSVRYEEKCMVPDISNKKTADETTAILLYDVPQALRPFGLKVVAALMDERLRRAMMYDAPPRSYETAINVTFRIRAFLLRHLALPRPYLMRIQRMSKEADKNGRYHMLDWDHEPWYVKNSFANRWSPKAWLKWMMGLPYPGSGEYRSDGYVLQDVGPKNLEGKGLVDVAKTKEKLMAQGRGGCPFAFAKG